MIISKSRCYLLVVLGLIGQRKRVFEQPSQGHSMVQANLANPFFQPKRVFFPSKILANLSGCLSDTMRSAKICLPIVSAVL